MGKGNRSRKKRARQRARSHSREPRQQPKPKIKPKTQQPRKKEKNKNMLGDRSATTKVFVTPEVYNKQRALIDRCDVEIAWFGTVEEITYQGETAYLVDDIIVPEQTVSMGSVDAAGKDLLPTLMQYAEIAHKLNYFAHSHVNFPAKPSQTDRDQIKGWEKYGMPFIITHIENKDGEMSTRFDQFEPRYASASAELMIMPSRDELDWADEQMFEKLEVTETNTVTIKGQKKFVDEIIKHKGERKRVVSANNYAW